MTNGRPIDPRLATLLSQGMTSRLVPVEEEEALQIQLRIERGKLYVVMSKSVNWFGLDPGQARTLAGALVEAADKAELGSAEETKEGE